jgi:hypothetical protein
MCHLERQRRRDELNDAAESQLQLPEPTARAARRWGSD